MKTTPWFDMSVEPVRDGVYELLVSNSKTVGYSRFWRGFWRAASWSKSVAAQQKHHSLEVMYGSFDGWRGLTEKPE